MIAKPSQTFDLKYAVALGAGLAAALLFLVARQGTLFAVLVACLTPLPIMIATLGFGPLLGLSAAFVGIATIILFMVARTGDFWTIRLLSAALLGGMFALVPGLPAWWLGRLARLRRSEAGKWIDAARGTAAGDDAHYPIDRILAHAALLACLIVVLAFVAVVFEEGGFDSLIESWAGKIAPNILEIIGTRELPAGVDLHELSLLYVKLVPPFVTTSYLLMLMGNLWLASRIVQISHLLVRPWPDIAQDLRLPRFFALAFLASLALCWFGGLPGMIASCVAAALGLGLVMAGLAVIHALTRGIRFRTALLAALYVALGLVPLMLVFVLGLGIFDAGLSFRQRNSLSRHLEKN